MSAFSPRPAGARGVSAQPSLGQLLNTANLITLTRLLLIPVYLVLLSRRHFTYALELFCFAAATDAFDGTVARWFGTRTELGAFLDPFADKLLLLSSFVVLTVEGVFPGWLLSVVAVRDVVLVFGYILLSFITAERIPVRPTYLGKATTVVQVACVIAALVPHGVMTPGQWRALLLLATGVTAVSGVHYCYEGLLWLGAREPGMFA